MDKALPKTIYKYRNWDDLYHKKILTENSLFCSPANLFNDPFDCKIYKNHFLLNTPEKKDQYVENSIRNYIDWLKNNGRDIDKEKFILRQRLNDIESYQKESENIEDDYTDKYLGIVSFSARWDSILMWSHYSNYHQGFCIGFNEYKLRNSRLFGKGGNVIYTNDFPVFDPLISDFNASLFKPLYKSKEWEYEQEYRMMNLYFDNKPNEPNRVIVFDDEYIEEIILGLKASQETKKEIIGIAKVKKVPVFEIEKVPFKFELTRKQIL